MGRKIPFGESPHPNHSLLVFIFLTASIAAVIGIVSSLCGLLERFKGSPEPEPDKNIEAKETESSETENVDKNDNSVELTNSSDEEKYLQQPLPPPPGQSIRATSCNLRTTSMAPNRVSRSSSSIKSIQNKLSTSMSLKAFSGALSHCDIKNSKMKHDDSIWKKQIILGEKCKVPTDEDDTVIYDKNGNRITTYHPKQLNAISMSRQSSEIDENAIPKKK